MATISRKGKRRGSGVTPYKLMLTLMYGHHKWIERDQDKIRFPNAIMAKHLKVGVARIQEYLYLLEDWDIIGTVRVNKYWTTVSIIPPVNMVHNMGETIDVR